MAAGEFQESVDHCKFRTLQRNDGGFYRCKLRDCHHCSCRYSGRVSGSHCADKEDGGAGTQDAGQTAITAHQGSNSSQQVIDTESKAGGNAAGTQGAASSYGDTDPDVVAATAALDALLASGYKPRSDCRLSKPQSDPKKGEDRGCQR